ncbi:hypothetical protein BN2497_10193 [Janthinobacterium sp. CG23_2]|nr:hypothetical protein BN2497_10193 [Janthinobacterium sp. CG23_2]CUU31494.1 hypothetical protein BN3177_10193 [Janthinobacterium sp. CG23_2]
MLLFATRVGEAKVHKANVLLFNHLQDFCGRHCHAYLS